MSGIQRRKIRNVATGAVLLVAASSFFAGSRGGLATLLDRVSGIRPLDDHPAHEMADSLLRDSLGVTLPESATMKQSAVLDSGDQYWFICHLADADFERFHFAMSEAFGATPDWHATRILGAEIMGAVPAPHWWPRSIAAECEAWSIEFKGPPRERRHAGWIYHLCFCRREKMVLLWTLCDS